MTQISECVMRTCHNKVMCKSESKMTAVPLTNGVWVLKSNDTILMKNSLWFDAKSWISINLMNTYSTISKYYWGVVMKKSFHLIIFLMLSPAYTTLLRPMRAFIQFGINWSGWKNVGVTHARSPFGGGWLCWERAEIANPRLFS